MAREMPIGTLATTVAPPATPVNPNTPATIEITRIDIGNRPSHRGFTVIMALSATLTSHFERFKLRKSGLFPPGVAKPHTAGALDYLRE
jgi:hypothetical protein